MRECSGYFKKNYDKKKEYSRPGWIKKGIAFLALVFSFGYVSCVSIDEETISKAIEKEKAWIISGVHNSILDTFKSYYVPIVKKEIEGILDKKLKKEYIPLLKDELKKEMEKTLDKKLQKEYVPLMKKEFQKVIDEQLPEIVKKYASEYFNTNYAYTNDYDIKKKVKDLTLDVVTDEEFVKKIVESAIDKEFVKKIVESVIKKMNDKNQKKNN